MKLEFLYSDLTKSNIERDSLISFYDFKDINQIFLQNKLYSIDDQLIESGDLKVINKSYFPAFFSEDSSHLNGSGLFNGNNYLSVSNSIGSGPISILLNYTLIDKYQYVDGYHRQINKSPGAANLIEINSTGFNDEKFNFKLMINTMDKLFVRFSGQYFQNELKTELYYLNLDNFISEKNIISISLDQNILTLNHYDIYYDNISSRTLTCKGNYNSNYKDLFFCKPNIPYYYGFSGAINNIIVFNENISTSLLKDLALSIIKTGQITTSSEETFTEPRLEKSGFLNPTGVINTITGYNFFLEKPLYGDYYLGNSEASLSYITGERLDFKYIESSYQQSEVNEVTQNFYDLDLKEKFKPLNIKDVNLELDYPVNLINI